MAFTKFRSSLLYNNKFKKIPLKLGQLKNLKFVDLHDNKFKLNLNSIDNQNFGYKMRF
jgi:Leucine-rich repeat (LRR) protein